MKCVFSMDYICQLILLFRLFLLLFIGPTALFDTVHESHCIISASFYLYLQYFQQKNFSFSKISRSQMDTKLFVEFCEKEKKERESEPFMPPVTSNGHNFLFISEQGCSSTSLENGFLFMLNSSFSKKMQVTAMSLERFSSNISGDFHQHESRLPLDSIT